MRSKAATVNPRRARRPKYGSGVALRFRAEYLATHAEPCCVPSIFWRASASGRAHARRRPRAWRC
jgi:hypothetical protein